MKIKKINRFLAILLLISLMIQPMPMQKAQAAVNGAVVTGASGVQYTLNHQYIKQLNINTGSITITDTGYSQINGATENWDSAEDAYVIKGQGTSENTITISTTNNIPTIYLIEVEWSGTIRASKSCNLVIAGGIKTNGNLLVSQGGSLSISGMGASQVPVEAGQLISPGDTNGNTTTTISLKNIKFDSDYFIYNSSSHSKYIGNMVINNCTLSPTKYSSGASMVSGVTIANSTIKNIYLYCGQDTTSNTIVKYSLIDNCGLGSKTLDIENSTILNGTINLSKTGTADIRQSVIDGVKFARYNTSSPTKLKSSDSTFLNMINNDTPSVLFDHCSYYSILKATPVDSNADDLYYKKVRFRDYPSTYVLTTFQDGHTSKLLTDINGYLYPYIPVNSTHLAFQVTDEKGVANFGNYTLDFEAITSDDSVTSEPTVAIPPIIVTFSPYANTYIEYSFDRVNWSSVLTNSDCQFSVVFPEGVKKIYVRYNATLYSIDIDESGNPSGAVQLKPEIISQSANGITFVKGIEGSIFVNVRPVHTGSALHYQWYKDGSPITGETSNILVLRNPEKTEEGIYTCIVSEDGAGSTASSPISIYVMDGFPEETSLGILAQSGSRTVTEDSRVELYVIPTVSEAVSYQWKKNGTDIAGATSAIYEISCVKQSDEGTFTCVLTKESAVITSAPIALSVEPNPLSGEISNLEAAVDTLTTQVNILQGQLDAANNNLAIMQNTITTLTAQITELNNQISALQSQIGDMGENNTDLQNQIIALQELITDLQAELDTANADKAGLQLIINDLNIEVSNKDTQIVNLQSRLDTSENENVGLQNQITVLNTQINNMVIQIETLNVQMITLVSERDTLQNLLNTANITISSLQQQVLELTNDNNDLRSKLASTLQQILNLEEQVNSLIAENTSLEIQISGLEAQIMALQDQLEGTGEDTSGLLQQISNLTAQINDLTAAIRQKEEQILHLDEQIISLNTTIANLQIEVSNAMESLSEYEGLALQDKINLVLSESERLKNDISALVQEKGTLLSQIADLNNLIFNLQGENTSLSQQLQEAENLINSLQNSLMAEISKSNSLQGQVNSLNDQVKELQMQLVQAESDKDELNRQITNLQDDLTNITNQLYISKQTIEELSSQIAGLNGTIINLQTQINNALSELSEYEGSDLLEKIRDIKAKQSKVIADLYKANSLNTDMNSQLNTANAQLLSLQQQVVILTGQLSDKDAQIKELLALIKQRDEDIAGKNTQIGDLQNQVQTLQAALDSLPEGNDAIIKLQQQVDELTSQITVLNAKISELTGKIADRDTLINSLNKQLDAKNTEISNMQNQIETLRNAGSGQSGDTNLQAEITYLSDKLNKANDVINDLKKQLENLNQNPVTVAKQDDNTPENPNKLNVPMFTMYKTIYLGYDYRVQLSNTENYEVSFKSSDSRVAKVDQNGLITSVKKGKAVVTCTVGSNYTYKIVVTVADGEGKATLNLIAPEVKTADTPVLLMYKQVKKGSATRLKLSGLDDDSEVTYVNVNPKVAAISKNGTISGISKGSTDVLVIVTHAAQHYIYYVKIRVDDGSKDTSMWEYLTAK